MIRTGIFDETGEIELTSNSTLNVIQNGRVVFVGHVAAPPAGEPPMVRLVPVALTLVEAVASKSFVLLDRSAFKFHNGGGWIATIPTA